MTREHAIRIEPVARIGDEITAHVDEDGVEDVEFDDAMTEERAAGLVEGVHRSEAYQRAKRDAFRRRRGRPALFVEPSTKISARVTVMQQKALRRAAEERGTSVGAVVRDAVDEYLRTHAS